MKRKYNEIDKKWGNRDWIWLTTFLMLTIILLISSIFAENTELQINFSIVSSAVSIALGLVAIFIAVGQSKDNQELSSTLKETMAVMHEKLNNVGEKVSNVDEKVNRLESEPFFIAREKKN